MDILERIDKELDEKTESIFINGVDREVQYRIKHDGDVDFVVTSSKLPNLNNDPYSMYLMKGDKIVKELGTHPSLKGSQKFYKNNKSRLYDIGW